MQSWHDLDTPLPAPWSDSGSTPDSLDAPNLSWPFDSDTNPDELHDFIFDNDDSGDEPLTILFDGDGGQSSGIGASMLGDRLGKAADEYDVVNSAEPSTAAEAAVVVAAEGETAPYAPIVRSSTAKRVVCQSACVHCRRAKTRCNGQRPCARCTTQGRADECTDRPTEEIERGKQNRKRKPKANSNKTTQQHPLNSADVTTPPQPTDPTHPLIDPLQSWPFLTQCRSLTSPAARLAFGQSAILRHSIVARVNRLCATRPADDRARRLFIRAVHLFLSKWSDAISPTEFDMFVVGRLPGTDPNATVAPLPSCLRMWQHVETRPLFLDWTPSPSVCEADATSDAFPTVRISAGPAAQRALERWENRLQATSEQQQPVTGQVQDGNEQPVEEVFSCLGISDTPVHAADDAQNKQPSSMPLHAPWCPVRAGLTTPNPPADSTVDHSYPPAPLPCVCFAATALPTSLTVNAAWERMYGYSQAEVRQQLMRRGSSVQMEWFAAESWWSLHCLIASHALIDKKNGYRFRAFVVIRTRWGAELPSMVEKRIVELGDGATHSIMTFTPLAQVTQQHYDE